jgi:hypothetical protein
VPDTSADEPAISARGRRLIAAVLSIDAGTADAIRARTPARRRPLRQVGPSADYQNDGAGAAGEGGEHPQNTTGPGD